MTESFCQDTLPDEYEYEYFLICPMKLASPEENATIADFISAMESKGKKVYYAKRNTNQNNPPYHITADNMAGMQKCAHIALFYSKTSRGTLFDFGMAKALGKLDGLLLVNPEALAANADDFFAKLVLEAARHPEATCKS